MVGEVYPCINKSAQQCAMLVNLVRCYSHFVNALPFYIVPYYKTPFLYQYTSGVAVNIYMIFILTKMLFILNVSSLK